MKKIIALALALIMALSMGVVAFAAPAFNPGDKLELVVPGFTYTKPNEAKREWKVSYDFTSAKNDYRGASAIESIELNKNNNLVITFKESLTNTDEMMINGLVTLTSKINYTLDANNKKVYVTKTIAVGDILGNNVEYGYGTKKADEAGALVMVQDTVVVVEEAGYFTINPAFDLTGTVKLAKGDKVQTYALTKEETKLVDEDLVDAIDTYLGEDYEGIVEFVNFAGTGLKDVDFQYDAYAEDPHFFYAWDGEKFVDLEAKFNADEDVEKYEFTADAKGVIIVTDVELVAAAEETKNPDTGANDVVGVAAALAVVSLVAAGAVSLKK